MSKCLLSGRERNEEATADAAAVLRRVNSSPSNKASGTPVLQSIRMKIACTVESPRSRFAGATVTSFTPRCCSGCQTGINNKTEASAADNGWT